MSSTTPLTEEIAFYNRSLDALLSEPSLSNLMSALRAALRCNMRLDEILTTSLPVIRQPGLELLKQITKSLPQDRKFHEVIRLDQLFKVSPITALSEVFWVHLEDVSVEELWTDGKRIFSVQQYVRYVEECKDDSTQSLLSVEALEAIKNAAYASADRVCHVSVKSNRLASAALERGYRYVPWGVFVNEYISEYPELLTGVRSLSQLISNYFADSSKTQLRVLPESDRQTLCILFTAIARRIFDQITEAADDAPEDVNSFLKNSAMRGDSYAVLIDRGDANEILFDYLSLAQNIALLCAALDVDPIVNNLLSEGEFSRQYFDEYPVAELYDAIIYPSTNLELLFLPPSGAKRVCESLNPYESKSYDLFDILRFASFGIQDSERDFAAFRTFLENRFAYSNEDDEILLALNPLFNRLTALTRTWTFNLRDLDRLNRHTDRELISDPLVQKNIKATFAKLNEVPDLASHLPLKWLTEYPPIINAGHRAHPALCVIEFSNADYCVDSRPNEWLTVAASLRNYGFVEAACTVVALMLLCDGKLVSGGGQSELKFRELSRLVRRLRGIPSFSIVEYALDRYREMTQNRISATAEAFLADLFPRNGPPRLATVKPIKPSQLLRGSQFTHPKFDSLSELTRNALADVLEKLRSESYDSFFMAHSIVSAAGTAIEHEFRDRFGDVFKNDKVFEELTSSRIRVNRKYGPDGLKAFSNILRNFHGFSETTRAALSPYSKICALKECQDIIKAIDMLAELTNARHGQTSDFEKPSDWIGRAESVEKILLDMGLLRALCETA